MKHPASYLFAILALMLAGCNGVSKLTGFWNDADVTVSPETFNSAQDRFAEFAELLVKAPETEAAEALEPLFEKIRVNESDYFIYTEWMESAFHNYFSPCRNAGIFETVVNRLEADGILEPEEVARLQKLAAQDRLNRPGEPCTVPEEAVADGPALYLVLNLDCRTCLQSLEALAGVHPEAEHIALCFGYTRLPSVPGWKYLKPEGLNDIFELDAAPFWFLTGADGTVEIPYSAEL